VKGLTEKEHITAEEQKNQETIKEKDEATSSQINDEDVVNQDSTDAKSDLQEDEDIDVHACTFLSSGSSVPNAAPTNMLITVEMPPGTLPAKMVLTTAVKSTITKMRVLALSDGISMDINAA